MGPLLSLAEIGGDHSFRESQDVLAKQFDVSDEERRILLPSGRAQLFTNRVGWAKTHLKMAGLIENRARGIFRITERGAEVLRKTKGQVDLRTLQAEPGYALRRHPHSPPGATLETDVGKERRWERSGFEEITPRSARERTSPADHLPRAGMLCRLGMRRHRLSDLPNAFSRPHTRRGDKEGGAATFDDDSACAIPDRSVSTLGRASWRSCVRGAFRPPSARRSGRSPAGNGYRSRDGCGRSSCRGFRERDAC